MSKDYRIVEMGKEGKSGEAVHIMLGRRIYFSECTAYITYV